MSYVNKPGKTTDWRKMVTRQQVSDFISFGKITTTATKAKETQRHVEWLITLAKEKNLVNTREMGSIFLDTKYDKVAKLITKAYDLGKKYANRKGGYTRILKLGTRPGDRTEECLLELV
ncbi:MAG: 50S ribosomal protein L17 [Mycoplasmoidaceae bacterium]|nr:MAG: 50S ribosomal protein L17 [Mycoplasmoidaceae bacterium]GMO17184.1 MAG: 50S ribosomal protein L17 [Mycoplasmoidaceae bacterium]